MRWALTLLSWSISVAVFAVVAFFAVMSLAGPHGGILPPAMEPFVLMLGWSLVLVVPILIARRVWRRVGGKEIA